MSDRPIIFSAPMVRALLAGRKTQTRRLLTPQPETFLVDGAECEVAAVHVMGEAVPRVATGRCLTLQKLRYAAGDRLYVREACAIDGDRVFFRAGHEEEKARGPRVDVRWRPSIHMPRWASRLTLVVKDVRVERLQAISEADALAEGIIEYEPTNEDPAEFSYIDGGDIYSDAREAFRALWHSLHPAPGERWDDNPFVVALTFRVIPGNIDHLEVA